MFWNEEAALRPKHDLSGLIAWVYRDEWRGPMQETLSRHTAQACLDAEVDLADIKSIVGDHAVSTVWGASFEDLLATNMPDGRNLADEYLKRRGWKESASTREYIVGLRHSVMSLYEVSGLVPGESMLLRDLIRGGEPVRVMEKSGSQGLRQWDRIATRVIPLRDKSVISGTLMRLDHEASDILKKRLAKIARKRVRQTKSEARGDDGGTDQQTPGVESAVDQLLSMAAFMFTNLWLSDELHAAQGNQFPELCNAEGDPIAFTKIHFPLKSGVTLDQVTDALNTLPALQQEDASFWNWLSDEGPHKKAPPKKQSTKSLVTRMEDGALVLGTISLQARRLTLEVNSEARATRGRALLEQSISGLVGPPLIEHLDLAELRKARGAEPTSDPLSLSPEEKRDFIKRTLDAHYRQIIEEPIPALGNKSPRTLIKTPKGREMVAAWLKRVENHGEYKEPDDPLRSYDFTWLWRELGLEALRR
ncbi:MAG: hypothetical protein ING30_05300 [Burkholderiales bacterium]|nr:hypothetical protein [Burkholderiales bacterium]